MARSSRRSRSLDCGVGSSSRTPQAKRQALILRGWALTVAAAGPWRVAVSTRGQLTRHAERES